MDARDLVEDDDLAMELRFDAPTADDLLVMRLLASLPRAVAPDDMIDLRSFVAEVLERA